MIRLSNRTTTYQYNDDIMIDIIEADTYEAWIYGADYGIKSLMFGLPKESTSLDEFIKLVEINLESGSYIQDYKDEYMK